MTDTAVLISLGTVLYLFVHAVTWGMLMDTVHMGKLKYSLFVPLAPFILVCVLAIMSFIFLIYETWRRE